MGLVSFLFLFSLVATAQTPARQAPVSNNPGVVEVRMAPPTQLGSPTTVINRMPVPGSPQSVNPEGPSHPVAEASDRAALEELERNRAQVQQAYEALNQQNPLSNDFQKEAAEMVQRMQAGGVTLPQGEGSMPALSPQLAKVQAMLSNPYLQKYMKVMAEPEFMPRVGRLIKNPNRNTLLVCEVVLFILFLMVRSYYQSRLVGFMSRMAVGLGTLAVFWVLSGMVLPSVILGEDYVAILNSVWTVMKS